MLSWCAGGGDKECVTNFAFSFFFFLFFPAAVTVSRSVYAPRAQTGSR